MAQGERIVVSGSDTTRHKGLHNVGWIRSHTLDNWRLDAAIGGHLYMGYEDNKGKLSERLMPVTEVHFGRWIFPVIGIRLSLGYGYSRGYISADSYLSNRGKIIENVSYGHCEGLVGVNDINVDGTMVDALGGYYWTTDDPSLLVQKWKYAMAGADLMVNMSYMGGFENMQYTKRWNNIVYAGFNIRFGLSENHPQMNYHNTNTAAEGHLGYIGEYIITKNLSIGVDLRFSVVEGNFDRERIPGVEKMSVDFDASAMVQLTYNFNLRSEKSRRNYYVEQYQIPYNVGEMPRFMAYVQVEDEQIVRIIDTIKVLRYDTIDDEIVFYQIDSLQHVVDSLRKAPAMIDPNVPLSDILGNKLLPYEMVFFEKNQWDIRWQEETKIAKMAKVIKAYPEATFYLYGSADVMTGSVKRNDFLSKMRADMVYTKLIYDYGVDSTQLRRQYLGGIAEYDPYILNRTCVIIMDHPAVRRAFEAMKPRRY